MRRLTVGSGSNDTVDKIWLSSSWVGCRRNDRSGRLVGNVGGETLGSRSVHGHQEEDPDPDQALRHIVIRHDQVLEIESGESSGSLAYTTRLKLKRAGRLLAAVREEPYAWPSLYSSEGLVLPPYEWHISPRLWSTKLSIRLSPSMWTKSEIICTASGPLWS